VLRGSLAKAVFRFRTRAVPRGALWRLARCLSTGTGVVLRGD
jgi:hypothetical protein